MYSQIDNMQEASMNTIGIDNNLDRARIRILLAIGLLCCALTGAGDFLLGYAEHAEVMGNAVTFGGLLVTLPSEERFREFRARLGMPA